MSKKRRKCMINGRVSNSVIAKILDNHDLPELTIDKKKAKAELTFSNKKLSKIPVNTRLNETKILEKAKKVIFEKFMQAGVLPEDAEDSGKLAYTRPSTERTLKEDQGRLRKKIKKKGKILKIPLLKTKFGKHRKMNFKTVKSTHKFFVLGTSYYNNGNQHTEYPDFIGKDGKYKNQFSYMDEFMRMMFGHLPKKADCVHLLIGSSSVFRLLKGDCDFSLVHRKYLSNNARQLGKHAEKAFLNSGAKIKEVQPCSRSSKYPFLCTTGDYIIYENRKRVYVEIKSTQNGREAVYASKHNITQIWVTMELLKCQFGKLVIYQRETDEDEDVIYITHLLTINIEKKEELFKGTYMKKLLFTNYRNFFVKYCFVQSVEVLRTDAGEMVDMMRNCAESTEEKRNPLECNKLKRVCRYFTQKLVRIRTSKGKKMGLVGKELEELMRVSQTEFNYSIVTSNKHKKYDEEMDYFKYEVNKNKEIETMYKDCKMMFCESRIETCNMKFDANIRNWLMGYGARLELIKNEICVVGECPVVNVSDCKW